MKRIRIVGLCLLAVFAFSAVAAASASAAKDPIYRVCLKVKVKDSGKYTAKNCNDGSKVETGGSYERGEWNQGKTTKFKGTNGVSTLTSYIKGFGIVGSVSCTKAKNAGEVVATDRATVTVTFEKCKSSGETCTSTGAKAGDIVTFLLTSLLIPGPTGKLAVRVSAASSYPETTGKSAEFACGAEKVSTTGSVDGELKKQESSVGTSKESEDVFAVNEAGENEITNEEGGTAGENVLLTEVVGVGSFESGENTTSKLKGEATLAEM